MESCTCRRSRALVGVLARHYVLCVTWRDHVMGGGALPLRWRSVLVCWALPLERERITNQTKGILLTVEVQSFASFFPLLLLWNLVSFLLFSENQQRTVPDLELRHKLQLNSGCGFQEFTNFTVSFKETLDYVFIDSAKLKTSQVIPMPSIEELSQFDAIPSVVFPSDHIALVCDLAFKDLSSQTWRLSYVLMDLDQWRGKKRRLK